MRTSSPVDYCRWNTAPEYTAISRVALCGDAHFTCTRQVYLRHYVAFTGAGVQSKWHTPSVEIPRTQRPSWSPAQGSSGSRGRVAVLIGSQNGRYPVYVAYITWTRPRVHARVARGCMRAKSCDLRWSTARGILPALRTQGFRICSLCNKITMYKKYLYVEIVMPAV